MYRVLIVDDEFLARKLLQGYVEKIPYLELAGTCPNAFEALEIIKAEQIDILLLDIHMPDLNGLEFAKTCPNIPAIIFTTAYSQYALDSYEVSAVDYLLKPIGFPRFMQAIEKALLRIGHTQTTSSPTAVTAEDKVDTSGKDFIVVKADYKLYKINFSDLLYIEGQHEYVSFYTTGKRITALYSLKSLEEILPSDKFIRIHKSYIVSVQNISEIEQLTVTCAGAKIPIGGNYRDNLNSALGIPGK